MHKIGMALIAGLWLGMLGLGVAGLREVRSFGLVTAITKSAWSGGSSG